VWGGGGVQKKEEKNKGGIPSRAAPSQANSNPPANVRGDQNTRNFNSLNMELTGGKKKKPLENEKDSEKTTTGRKKEKEAAESGCRK